MSNEILDLNGANDPEAMERIKEKRADDLTGVKMEAEEKAMRRDNLEKKNPEENMEK